MNTIPLEIVFAFAAVAGMGTAILSLFTLRLTLTRRLKKKLKPSGDYWETGTLDFGFFNTFIFAYACTLPFVPRSEYYRILYKDLDVKRFATLFEKGAAYAMVTGFLVFFISIPFFYWFKP
ncbi:hypothetical protein [Hydrocarboniclastica marina]|uniref:Uncharacterized protein n=1 Tax=Hydrocarboniclastica marina TaxID=2259620 RepID=A0A4P7XLC8_9ALTE|nr:hypothetical protein [Hydrocarboniclastica marina]QCF27192.1 hypothetical protein soil367_15340 [Hydrocarboniclastica marina]